MTIDLTEVYREQASFVWRSLRRLGASEEAAEDLMHDVFVIAHRKQADYDQRAAVSTWLFGIVRRVAANHRRKAVRRAALEPVDGSGARADRSQEECLEHERAGQRVREFMHSLSPDKRAVFELVDVEGMSCPDVARALDVSLDQVYARLRTARRRFESFAASLAVPQSEVR